MANIKLQGNTKIQGKAFFDLSESAPIPTYTVTADNHGNINEGTTVTFTLNTTNVPNGTLVPYTITGINQEDLSSGSVTGNFTVSNNTATTSITLANDLLTEGDETLRLALDNGYNIFYGFSSYPVGVIDSSRGFLPEDLGNLIAHWDYRTGVGNDGNTLAATGDTVKQWITRAGSESRTIFQSTLSLQPTVLEDGGLYFNNKTLGSNSIFSELVGINGPLTYYIVGKNFSANSTDVPIVKVGNGTSASTYRFSFSSDSFGTLRMSNGTARMSDIIPNNNSDDRPVIISADFNNGNGNIYKGTNVGTIQSQAVANIGTGLNSANSPTAFTLGGRYFTSNTQTLTNTTIYHVLVYTAIHTNSERLQVMNYLKSNTRNGSVSF
jgi:hypothetical protein